MRRILTAIVLIVWLGALAATASAQSSTAVGVLPATAANSVPLSARPDQWRYRWHQGYWWYYTPRQDWLIYENNAWRPFIAPPPVPLAPAIVTSPQQTPGRSVGSSEQFGVDSP